jgi:hypothetical protein
MATPRNNDKITYFAETDYRSKRIKFGIKDSDRARHMYIIGKTGMGKSTLLENLAIQDIQNGEGLCFIDPHGGTAETLLSYVPEHRVRDVVYLAPFDLDYPVAINVMEDIGADKRSLVASGLIGAFKKVWVDAWSPRMEYLLNNALLALLEYPGSTLLGVNRIFADKNYRSLIVGNVQDPSVKAFWTDEYAKYSDKFATEATAAIQNKVGQFAANPLIRNMVGQPLSSFDIRKVMDEKKILIVNLSKGRLGEGNANLIGSMLITKIYLAAMSRADVGPEAVKDLPPFYLYVDEFQSFANESFADILSEARKYKLSLTIAHQYIEQMSDEVRAAVFGNVGTMITFRIGPFDAEVFEKEFSPTFTAEDLVNLGFAQVYMKLMINQIGSPPFSATTLPRPKVPARTFAAEVIDASREQFARPRSVIEEEIKKWHEPVPEPPRDPNAPPETRKYAAGMRPERRAGASAGFVGAMGERRMPPRTMPDSYGNPMQHQGGAQAPQQFQAPAGYPQYVQIPSQAMPMQRAYMPAKYGAQGQEAGQYYQPQAMPAPIPAAQAAPEMHQPFRSELSKIITDAHIQTAPYRAASTHESRQHGDRRAYAEHERRDGKDRRHEPAPLSALKNHPKKDKGPSQENLSGLRAALAAAADKPNDEIRQNTPLPTREPQRQAPLLDASIAASDKKGEVPEDVLRTLLAD